MKSWKKPTHSQIEKAVSLLAHAEQYRYFFDKLNNPLWIVPLVGKGYFINPPRIVENDGKGTVRFPPWPEFKYLIRMADYEVAQKDIADIILKIDTDNISVIGDFLDCLTKMPADLVVKAVPKVRNWINSGAYWLLPQKYAALIVHLANLECTKESIQLSRGLLAVQQDPRNKNRRVGKNDDFVLPPDAVPKYNIQDYKEVLEIIVPTLAQKAGTAALEMFCDILEAAIKMSLSKVEETKPEDFSYIWRPAIEDHEQNLGESIKDDLVTALRDTLQILLEANPLEKRTVLASLSKRQWKIFHRLVLFSINKFPDDLEDLISEEITNEANFLDPSIRHEYFNLQGHYGKIPKNKQRIVLAWIAKGPDVEEYKKYMKQVRGDAVTEGEVQKYINSWKLSKYYPIAAFLDGKDKETYSDLISELGEPEHPSFTSYISSPWWGPTGPKKSVDLLAFNHKDLIGFLKDWEPANDMQSPSKEGLGREITATVANNPDHFEQAIIHFIGLDPTYVRAIITGYRDAAKNKKNIPWESLFTLAEWVLQQKYNPDKEEGLNEDVGWGRTRNSIVELLTTGFEHNAYQIPYSDRERTWGILHTFTTDPDPTKEREAQGKDKGLDVATLSINSTRGEAMHAVIKYALWIRRNLEKSEREEELNKKGFDIAPEVRDVLNDHLDLEIDPSLAIRSVYGQWLPWLIFLDKKWVQANLKTIFPEEEEYKELYQAAWETYISFCDPYSNVIDVVKDQYVSAVKRLSAFDSNQKQSHKDSHLIQHLAVYYWIGKLDLAEESLLQSFFVNAPTQLKAELIDFIGRSLINTKEEIPDAALNRLKTLWEFRLAAVKDNQGNEAVQQLEGFGWWFIAEKFDRKWSINQLLETLRLTNKIDADHKIIEHLEALTEIYPKEVVECITLMLEGEKEGWGLLYWGKNLRNILVKVLSSKDPNAITMVENLVNALGKKGLMDYRDLIK